MNYLNPDTCATLLDCDLMIMRINQNLKTYKEKSLRNEEKIKKVFKGVIKMMVQTFKKLNDLDCLDEFAVADKFINAYFSAGYSQSEQSFS